MAEDEALELRVRRREPVEGYDRVPMFSQNADDAFAEALRDSTVVTDTETDEYGVNVSPVAGLFGRDGRCLRTLGIAFRTRGQRGEPGRSEKKRVPDKPHNISTATAVASPPPMQSDATPRFLPCRLSALSSVTMMRAPDAPIG